MIVVRWARQGQNEANVSQTFSHKVYDADLTDLGRRQAAELAQRLAAEPRPADALVTSPLRRATQTGEIVAARLGLAASAVLEDLRELDVGDLDGRSDARSWQVYAQVLARWDAGDLAARFPGGEDGEELVTRVRRGLRHAAGLADAAPVIVGAHGGNLRAALPWLIGGPPPQADLATGAYAVLSVDPSGVDPSGVDPSGTEIGVLDWPEC